MCLLKHAQRLTQNSRCGLTRAEGSGILIFCELETVLLLVWQTASTMSAVILPHLFTLSFESAQILSFTNELLYGQDSRILHLWEF